MRFNCQYTDHIGRTFNFDVVSTDISSVQEACAADVDKIRACRFGLFLVSDASNPDYSVDASKRQEAKSYVFGLLRDITEDIYENCKIIDRLSKHIGMQYVIKTIVTEFSEVCDANNEIVEAKEKIGDVKFKDSQLQSLKALLLYGKLEEVLEAPKKKKRTPRID